VAMGSFKDDCLEQLSVCTAAYIQSGATSWAKHSVYGRPHSMLRGPTNSCVTTAISLWRTDSEIHRLTEITKLSYGAASRSLHHTSPSLATVGSPGTMIMA